MQFTVGRAVDMNGDIHIEGQGVPPTVKVPVDEETLFSDGDPLMDAAIDYLDKATKIETSDGGAIAIGDEVSGELAAQTRVRYTLEVKKDDKISIYLEDETGKLDTVLTLLDTGDNTLVAEVKGFKGETASAAIHVRRLTAAQLSDLERIRGGCSAAPGPLVFGLVALLLRRRRAR